MTVRVHYRHIAADAPDPPGQDWVMIECAGATRCRVRAYIQAGPLSPLLVETEVASGGFDTATRAAEDLARRNGRRVIYVRPLPQA